ncbi:recombinase family protein [Streptomyces sp. SR-10]|uniref:recombinase family protein n=1 Tax=Streptomyces sp. SR-10 TaxID=3416442 RepID=UPI003CE83CA3
MPAPRTERPVRIGYARTSTARQELASQLEALHRAECHKVFKEQISTRVKVRPELEKALEPARQFEEADKGVPVPEIVKKLTIKVGKNAGKSPSVASLYRALAEAEAAAVHDGLPLRPKPVRIRRPEDPLTPEEIDLRERLQSQPHPNAQIRS